MRNSMFFPGDTPQLPTRDPCWSGPVMIGLVKIGLVMIVMIGPAIVVGRVLLTKQCCEMLSDNDCFGRLGCG